ncbi:MAG: hypothetical protein WD077_07135 [Bacteroidia bacterium]
MQLLEKNEIAQMIGNLGLFHQVKLMNKLSYISGVEPFDRLVQEKKTFSPKLTTNLLMRKGGLEIQISNGSQQFYAAIPFQNLNDIVLEDKEQILLRKERSVLGKAMLRGNLLDPLGRLQNIFTDLIPHKGGIKAPDLYLSFSFQDDNNCNRMIILSCMYKNKLHVSNFLCSHLCEYYKV